MKQSPAFRVAIIVQDARWSDLLEWRVQRSLADLHMNYEHAAEYDLKEVWSGECWICGWRRWKSKSRLKDRVVCAHRGAPPARTLLAAVG